MSTRRAPRWRLRAMPAALIGLVGLSLSLLAGPASPALAIAPSSSPDFGPLERCVRAISATAELEAGGWTVTSHPYGYRFTPALLTRARWEDPPPEDAVLRLQAYGLEWIPALLTAMKATGDVTMLDTLIVRVAGTLAWRPDTGDRVDPVWSEGVNLRREQGLNCLYSVTRDDRLVPVMEAVAAANMDPNRYYGPPLNPPHNHGLMANIALIESARLLGRADWQAFAVQRLEEAIDHSFTPAGLTIEQSLAYHLGNIGTWANTSSLLRSLGGEQNLALAAHIDQVLVRARTAYDFVIQPDRRPVPIGDQQGGIVTVARHSTTALADKAAGILAARWSWTAPDDFWTLKFGGSARMHGHLDRTSLTWWSTGRQVVVDPGTATYLASPSRDWAKSNMAHSVAVVRGRSYLNKGVVALTSYVHRSYRDIAVISGAPYGVAQTRRVVVDPVANSLQVTDTAGAGLNQVWQLHSRWRLASLNATRTVARFVDSTGASLVVTTTGRVATVYRGNAARGLAGGWTFTYPPEVRTPAARMVITGGTSVRTTFVVKGTALRPWVR